MSHFDPDPQTIVNWEGLLRELEESMTNIKGSARELRGPQEKLRGAPDGAGRVLREKWERPWWLLGGPQMEPGPYQRELR